MTTKKVEKIIAWLLPHKVIDMRWVMGFANFYRWFIKRFSKIAKPLTDLIKNGIK